MKIAQISYTNTAPFFYYWNANEFELVPGTPKALADSARESDLIAGPLPLVETWNLEDQFEPLGDWCIAARQRCRSVFVLSKQPFSELDHVMIGATKDSATSVKLCEVLLREKYGKDARLRRGLQLEDAAWLVIGDQALKIVNSPAIKSWPYVTDLATEWWDWKKTPFVFARWVVRKDISAEIRGKLNQQLKANVERTMGTLPTVSRAIAPKLELPAPLIESYLSEMIYQMDDDARTSATEFRRLVQEGATSARRPVATH